MKKIIFVINNLEIGGIQRSLIELLRVLDGKYDITLYCINYKGDYISHLPQDLKVIRGNSYAVNPELTKEECLKKGLICFCYHMFLKVWSQLFGRRIPARIVCFLSGRVDEKYDYAISYAQPSHSHNCISLTNEIVLNNISAKEKITFVHCDYGAYGGDTKYNRWLYSKFDKVAAVSESVRRRFVEILSTMANNTVVVPNACDIEQIQTMASVNPIRYSKVSFVSISRLGPEKGLTRCVSLFRRLREDGYDFEWHIVGDGQERQNLEAQINAEQMSETIILEGKQSNPYRYLNNASCLFMPSFHEAAPMVFNESVCLGVPILTTNTLSAKELVEDRHFGVVCENNVDSIFRMLKDFLCGNIKCGDTQDVNVNEAVLDSFQKMCNTKI